MSLKTPSYRDAGPDLPRETVYWSMSDALLELRHLILGGEKVAPRGLPTREVRGVGFAIQNAVRFGAPVGVGRKLAGKLAAIEGAQNLAGASYPDVAVAVSKHLERFAEHDEDGNPFFHGAYGPRLADGLRACEYQLRRDPDCRQAVVSLWQENDREPHWNDRPCATEFQFLLRDNRLEMFVYMRSNDLWKGFCYDVFQFAQLQALLANVLGVWIGPYHHYAASLHVYEDDVERLEQLDWEDAGKTLSFGPPWAAQALYPHVGDAQHAFGYMLDSIRRGEPFDPANEVEAWYYDRIGGVL